MFSINPVHCYMKPILQINSLQPLTSTYQKKLEPQKKKKNSDYNINMIYNAISTSKTLVCIFLYI